MKFVCVFALLFAVAAAGTVAFDDEETFDLVLPNSLVQEALENNLELKTFEEIVSAEDSSEDFEDRFSLKKKIKKILKKPKCNSGECRKKCNAKGQNGACVLIKCVCWK